MEHVFGILRAGVQVTRAANGLIIDQEGCDGDHTESDQTLHK